MASVPNETPYVHPDESVVDTAERPTYAMGAIMNENLKIDAVLARRKYLVTCGTGGVGKTTLSAAIAIRAALAGKDAVVVTIDPAKRLATSLGLDASRLGNAASDLTPF